MHKIRPEESAHFTLTLPSPLKGEEIKRGRIVELPHKS